MPSLNSVSLIGNLTRDPELKYLPKGTAVCEIGLAINHNYTTESGEKREKVTFVDISAFGRTAEIIGEYCKKGRPVYIGGRLELDTWDDKTTGAKRSKLKIVADNVQFLSSGEKREGAPASNAPAKEEEEDGIPN